MKTVFGTTLSRLLRGGVVLSSLESFALKTLVSALPEEFRQTVEAQFERYVLVQREADGRALNFYPRRKEIQKISAPLLQMEVEEAPLMKIKFSVKNPPEEFHAVMHAVSGRVFCITFNQDVRPFANATNFEIENMEHSWRSNFSHANANN